MECRRYDEGRALGSVSKREIKTWRRDQHLPPDPQLLFDSIAVKPDIFVTLALRLQ